MQSVTGVIRGKTIQLDDAPEFAEGAEVELVIRPSRSSGQPGDGLLRTEGALASDADWDEIMEEVQQARQLERTSQSHTP
jgi:hypothetical protein